MAVAPKQSGLNILRRLVPLNTLSDEVLQGLMEKALFEKLEKGGRLFEKGDTDHYNVYLLSGRVAMLSGNREVDMVDAGSDTARFPIAHQIPRKFTVIAKTKVEIVRVDNRLLGELLAKVGNTAYEVSEFQEEETEDWMSQLLNSRVFQQIPASNIQSVMMRMQEQDVTEGEVVINYGDEGDYFYLINKGHCSVRRPVDKPQGEFVEVAQLGPGDSFGEEALLSDRPRSSTIVMLSPGVLLRLSKDDFVKFVKHPLARMISAEKAQAQVKQGAVLLDVRTSEEYEQSHFPGSLSLPFGSLRYQASSLDPEQRYIVYCGDGQLSTTAAYLLIEQGFDVSVLDGGLDQAQRIWDAARASTGEKVVALRPDQATEATGDDAPEDAAAVRSSRSDEAGKTLAFLKKELAVSQGRVREQQQQINNFKLAFDEAKDLLAKHQGGEKKALQQIKSLQEKIGRLEKDLDARKQEFDKLHAQNEKLRESEEQVQALDRRLKETTEQLLALQNDNRGLRGQVAATEAALEERDQHAAALSDEATSRQGEVEQLRAALEAQTETAGQQAAEREKRLVSLDEQLQQVSDRLSAANQRITQLETERDDSTRTAEEAESGAQSLRVRLGELEQQLAEEREQQALQQGEFTRQLDQAAEELTAARERGETLSSSLAEATAQIEALESSRSARDADLDATIKDLETRLGELGEAAQERDRLQAELARQQGELDQLQAVGEERDRLQQQVAELEGLKQAHADLEARLGELGDAAQERDRLQADLEARLGELGDAAQERDRLQAELARQQGELEQLQAVGEERDRLQQQVAELEGLKQAHADLEARLGELGEAAQERDRLQAELVRQQGELEQLQTLGEERDRLQQQVAELEGLKQAHADLEARLGELGEVAEERDRLQQQIQEWEMKPGATADISQEQLDGLRQELVTSETARQSAEKALELARRTATAASGGDVKALQAELDTLTDALEEADNSYADLQRQHQAAQSEITRLQAQLEQPASLVSEDALAEERAGRQRAEDEVERLKGEVAELRSVMQAYVDQIQSARESDGDVDLAALQEELALVRERAEADVQRLQQELQQYRSSAHERELSDSVDSSENIVLKEELEKLQQQISERETQIAQLTGEQYQLQERIETGKSEIERLGSALEMAQDEAEEAVFNRDEALEAKRLVDEALYKLQQDLEKERRPQELADNRLAASGGGKILDIGSLTGGSLVKGLLLGTLITFGAAEGLSIMAGKGELISGLFTAAGEVSEERSSQTPPAASKTGTDKQVPAQAQQADQQKTVSAVSAKAPDAPADRQDKAAVTAPKKVVIDRPEVAPPPVAESARFKPVTPIDDRPQQTLVVPPPPVRQSPAKEPETGRALTDPLSSGGFGPEMVYIRGAEFIMGSDRSQLEPEERPAHKVKLKSFAIGRYEVTFNEYAQFARATGRDLPDDLGWGRGRRPVINVSWEDAVAYTEWLSAETGKRYRLPTEAEWEYAASGGSASYYWWGYELEPGRANCYNCGSIWDGASTAPVGGFTANGFGLHNTAGNVLEWVQDCYHPDYVGAPADGSAWVEQGCRERSIRGGAFNKPEDAMRTTYRSRHDYDARLLILGFRVARDV